ncbi:glycoside hydrolase family 5 protein [Clostridia bacterium OttesenSCG-928-O13]|nr:glycoside hydrolase family 5 protein [Clostridia bacterium OttesenSCG-928-O13]
MLKLVNHSVAEVFFVGEKTKQLSNTHVGKLLCVVTVALLVWNGFGLGKEVRMAYMLPDSTYEDKMAFFKKLGPGWNLGNTLDAHSEGFFSNDPLAYECQWNNTPATRELFGAVHGAGFRTVRIPITWYPHLDDSHAVDEAWMQRVREVVDSALDSRLYVIINSHHDAWQSPFPDNLIFAEARLRALWSQVAEMFAGYDERLLFEGMNEPRLVGAPTEYSAGTRMARRGVNRLNQAFVETIRAAGGNNPRRYLLVPTYAASISPDVCADFVMPEDERTAVSLHVYHPFSFAHQPEEAGRWSAQNREDVGQVESFFEAVYGSFVQKGTPVAITEFGAIDKKNAPDRVEWTRYMAGWAAQRGIPCIWWDNGAEPENGTLHTFALLDRQSLNWHFPEVAQALVGAYPAW